MMDMSLKEKSSTLVDLFLEEQIPLQEELTSSTAMYTTSTFLKTMTLSALFAWSTLRTTCKSQSPSLVATRSISFIKNALKNGLKSMELAQFAEKRLPKTEKG